MSQLAWYASEVTLAAMALVQLNVLVTASKKR